MADSTTGPSAILLEPGVPLPDTSRASCYCLVELLLEASRPEGDLVLEVAGAEAFFLLHEEEKENC